MEKDTSQSITPLKQPSKKHETDFRPLPKRIIKADEMNDSFAYDKLILPYSGKITRWVKVF